MFPFLCFDRINFSFGFLLLPSSTIIMSIKNYSSIDGYENIAEQELLNNMIPFKIKRPMPDGTSEIWKISELKKDHLIYLLNEN